MASCNVQTIKINIFKNIPDDKWLREHYTGEYVPVNLMPAVI